MLAPDVKRLEFEYRHAPLKMSVPCKINIQALDALLGMDDKRNANGARSLSVLNMLSLTRATFRQYNMSYALFIHCIYTFGYSKGEYLRTDIRYSKDQQLLNSYLASQDYKVGLLGFKTVTRVSGWIEMSLLPIRHHII